MDAKLVVVGGKASKGEVKLKLPTVLGRSREAGLAIAHPNVSRRHCEIREVEGALVVRDLGSSNGTLVNDTMVKEVVLKPGDTLTIGPLVFRAEYKHAGKFPTLGKGSSKAAAADTLEFVPEDVAPEATKPAVDKTVAKDRKASPPPPAPEAKKTKPAKENVETVVPGKLEKVSKPQAKPSDLDDLSLPELEDLPAASVGKKAEPKDLPDLPALEEPAAAEWGELESPAPTEDADADLALPSLDESDSLPDLSDDLDLPEPEALAEEPELESPEVPATEAPAAENLESWGDIQPEEDLALADDLPPLDDVEAAAGEPDLDLPLDDLQEEVATAPEEAVDDLGLMEEELAEDLSREHEALPAPAMEEVAEPEMTWAEETPEPEAEAPTAEGDDLSDLTLEEPQQIAATADAEQAEEIGELGLIEEAQVEKPVEPDPAWFEEAALEGAELEAEPAEVDALPEMSLAEPDVTEELAAMDKEVHAEEELDELGLIEDMPPVAEAASSVPAPKALEPDPAWFEEATIDEPAALSESHEGPAAADESDEFGLAAAAKALQPDPAWFVDPTLEEAGLDAEPAEVDGLPEMTLEEEIEEVAAVEEEHEDELAELGLTEELPEEPVAESLAAEEDDLPEMTLEEPEEMEEVAAVEEETEEDELAEMALTEELPETPVAESLPEAEVDDLPEMTLEEAEEIEEVAAVEEEQDDELAELGLTEELPEEPLVESLAAEDDDLPEMALEVPEEMEEVAAVEEEIEADEIGEFGLIEELPVQKAVEPDPSWLDEPTPAEADLEGESVEDDLPEMSLEEAQEIEEIAAAAEPEEDDIGDFELIEELPDSLPAESPALEEDDLAELTLDEPQEVEEFAATEEESAEDEIDELDLAEEVPQEPVATASPQDTFDPSWLDEPQAELPPVADFEATIDAIPEPEEALAEEDFDELEPEPLAPIASVEMSAGDVEEEAELDWLDEESAEPAAAESLEETASDESAEPSLEELGLEDFSPEGAPAVRSDLPTATHEFTSVEPLEAMQEDLSWEPSAEAPTDEGDEPLEFDEASPAFTEMADDELGEEPAAETEEDAEEEFVAELPPAMPWQTEHDETAAWSPATEEPPPFSLQPEADRPAFFADKAPGAASAKQPQPAKKKKGWSLFGWLKKKEKPTQASSASPAAPPAFPATTPEPSFEEAETSPWSTESLDEEQPVADFAPDFAESAPEAGLDLPEIDLPESAADEPESELDLAEELDAAALPPAGEQIRWDEADLDEPEFAAIEPPAAGLDDSSNDINVEPPVADLDDMPEWESAESAEAPPTLEPVGEELASLEPLEMDSDDLSPVEGFDATAAFDEEELSDEIAPLHLPPAAESESPELQQDEQEGDIPWADDLAMMPQENAASSAVPPLEMSDDPWDDELAAMTGDENVAPPAFTLSESHEDPWGAGFDVADQPNAAADAPAGESPQMPWQVEHEETVAWTPSTDDLPGFTLQPEEDRPARYSEVEARAAKANKPAPPPAKKKGWSLFGWLKKKEKPTKASSAPPAAVPQFALPPPEPSFEEAEAPLTLPESEPYEEPADEFAAGFAEVEPEAGLDLPEINMSESGDTEFEPELEFSAPESAELPPAGFEPAWDEPEEIAAAADEELDELDLEEPELESVEPVAELDDSSEEIDAEIDSLEPIADLPEWEPEPEELPEEMPSLEPVAEDLLPLETESDDLPPMEVVEELQFEEEVEESSEEVPPLGSPPVPHASESHDDEQDATMQWSGDVMEFAEEPEEIAEAPPTVPTVKPSAEPPAAAFTPPAPPAAAEPAAAEDLPEFMRPKPTPQVVSGEDDDLNKFFQELGLK
jgi:hypothetical protein